MISRYRRLHAREHTGARLAHAARTPQLDNSLVTQRLLETPAVEPVVNRPCTALDSVASHDRVKLAANVRAARPRLRRCDIPMNGSCMFHAASAQDARYGFSAQHRLRCDVVAYVRSRRCHFREFFAADNRDEAL
jgi:hypothetical protein